MPSKFPEISSPLGDYLRARRHALWPADLRSSNLPRIRRDDGNQQDEVARLAGISQQHYRRLEQGRDRQPSEETLQALAQPLGLDKAALDYMRELVAIQTGGPHFTNPDAFTVSIHRDLMTLLNQWPQTPAYITSRNQTIICSNSLLTALLPGLFEPGMNLPLTVFGSRWRAVDSDWERTAQRITAELRLRSDPEDPELQRIVGLLSMRDAEFRRLWARHEALADRTDQAAFILPGFGRVDFTRNAQLIPGHPHHVLTVLHAESGTVAADAIRSLRATQSAPQIQDK